MEYFISDLHIDDENILDYEHRPFANLKEMEDTIIRNWNNKVEEDDTIYLLGDIGNPFILNKLKGHIVLVCGNHDNYEYLKNLYPSLEISKYPIMVNGLWLSHEPITFLPKECPYLNIHGHLHSLIYGTEDRTWKGGNRYFNVSVERINYTPISLYEIGNILEYHPI